MPTSLSVKANLVIHYHASIRKALKYAVKIDLLDSNPADKVECPKKDPFMGSFYDRKVRQKRSVYKRHKSACRLIFLAQRVGFEPTCSCLQTDFESAPL